MDEKKMLLIPADKDTLAAVLALIDAKIAECKKAAEQTKDSAVRLVWYEHELILRELRAPPRLQANRECVIGYECYIKNIHYKKI